MSTTGNYDLWNAEQATPTPPERRGDRPIDPILLCGFWRAEAAKTKPDYPIAIWLIDGEAGPAVFFKVGAGRRDGESLFNSVTHADRVDEFLQSTWFHCIAVSADQYHSAMAGGFWPSDQKPSRQMTEEQKLGIDTATGGNNPRLEESLADQIANLAAKLVSAKEPADKDQASALAGNLDRMRLLLKKADEARVTEKEPHLTASREVDAKWKAIGEPGGNAYRDATERQKAWLRKEQKRLDDIAAEETRKRQEEARKLAEAERIRLQAEADARAAAESERLRLEAEAAGFTAEEAEQVAEVKAEEVAAPVVEVAAVEAQRASASSKFGRASGLRAVKVAVVDDPEKLAAHFIVTKDTDFADYLLKRAASALRGKVSLPGCSTRDELQ